MNRYLTILFTGIIAFSCQRKQEVPQQKPVDIPVVKTTVQDVDLKKEFVGNVYGMVDIPIRARVEGFLEGIHFNEGRRVKKGQLLYTIDAQPFQASVAESQSKLAEAQVSLVKAENDLKRIQPLADINAVSKADLDAAIAQRDAAEANVQAAKAGVQISNINLGYTEIKSPIDGLIGKTVAKVGEFVGRSPNPVILNTVSQIDTIRVDFYITENDYLILAKGLLNLSDSGREAQRDAKRDLELILGDGSVYKHHGKVDFIDRGVDESTGAIIIQSSFPNPDQLIRPGQFARVRATMNHIPNALLIPQRSVFEFQGNFFVWAVNDSNQVAQTPIQIQGEYNDYYIVNSGINKESKIVFEGLQLMKQGLIIAPFDTVFQSKYAEK